MKTLFILLFALFALDTTAQDTTTVNITTDTTLSKIDSVVAKNYDLYFNQEGETFWLNYEDDSLEVGGTMSLSESAELFIKFCKECLETKNDTIMPQPCVAE